MGYPLEESPFAEAVRKELARAREQHAGQHSAREACTVILEELGEFWEEVKKKVAARAPGRMLEKLIQTATMCQRAAEDLGLVAPH